MPARFVRAFYHDHAPEMAAVALGESWQETKRILRQTRTAGVAVIHAELDPGVTGIAAPLFDPDGNVIGSLGLVLPGEVHPDTVLAETADFVRSAAKTIDATFAGAAGAATS
jgi:DNA-binding IclR family transcriptional regulator